MGTHYVHDATGRLVKTHSDRCNVTSFITRRTEADWAYDDAMAACPETRHAALVERTWQIIRACGWALQTGASQVKVPGLGGCAELVKGEAAIRDLSRRCSLSLITLGEAYEIAEEPAQASHIGCAS